MSKDAKTLNLFLILNTINFLFYWLALHNPYDFFYTLVVVNYVCLTLYLKNEFKLLVITCFVWAFVSLYGERLFYLQPILLWAFLAVVISYALKVHDYLRVLIGLLIVFIAKGNVEELVFNDIILLMNYLAFTLLTILAIKKSLSIVSKR